MWHALSLVTGLRPDRCTHGVYGHESFATHNEQVGWGEVAVNDRCWFGVEIPMKSVAQGRKRQQDFARVDVGADPMRDSGFRMAHKSRLHSFVRDQDASNLLDIFPDKLETSVLISVHLGPLGQRLRPVWRGFAGALA